MLFSFLLKPLQLQEIQKLGAYFRTKYSDWKITLLNDWHEESGVVIREITHEGGGNILVFAVVSMPKETFDRFEAELKNLGERSLGDHFLFAREDVKRESLEVFEEKGRFVRCSRFLVSGYPLTISEYFTEAGLACLQD